MNAAAPVFAEITAALEDMHGIAVEGQRRDADAAEGWMILAGLREGARTVARLMVIAASTLE